MDIDGSNAANLVRFSGAFTVGSRASGTTAGTNSVAFGSNNNASGDYSYAEGVNAIASNVATHAEGYAVDTGTRYIKANGYGAHAEGSTQSSFTGHILASGQGAHAEGICAYANGPNIEASGNGSHAEGVSTKAQAQGAHAEGQATQAKGLFSHCGGRVVQAYRDCSFVHGNGQNYKFSSMSFPESAMQQAFGVDMSGEEWTTNTTVTDSYHGCEGCVENTATVTLTLARAGMYLLITSTLQASNGSIYGSTARLITASASDSGTPTNVSLGSSGNTATIGVAANNKVTIKNPSASYGTQFSLMRVL